MDKGNSKERERDWRTNPL